MTNFHVIDKAKVIQVSFPKGRRYRGRVVSKDERNDLAVIKLLKMKPKGSGSSGPHKHPVAKHKHSGVVSAKVTIK